jgi:hypothetical protein
MISHNQRPVHVEFRLIERTNDAGDGRADPIGGLLRTAWLLPRDTFVIGDIPLLLTLLSVRPGSFEDAPAVSTQATRQDSEREIDEEDG